MVLAIRKAEGRPASHADIGVYPFGRLLTPISTAVICVSKVYRPHSSLACCWTDRLLEETGNPLSEGSCTSRQYKKHRLSLPYRLPRLVSTPESYS